MTNTERETKQAERALDEAKKRHADKDANSKKMPVEKKRTWWSRTNKIR